MARPESPLNGALKKILSSGAPGTQEEICLELKKDGHHVTQSTVSRCLRKLGAVRAVETDGRIVYKISELSAPLSHASLNELVQDIVSNGSIIVIRTAPGSASLVARHLDHYRPGGVLGTIAGDDTIFVAPGSLQKIRNTIDAIKDSLSSGNA